MAYHLATVVVASLLAVAVGICPGCYKHGRDTDFLSPMAPLRWPGECQGGDSIQGVCVACRERFGRVQPLPQSWLDRSVTLGNSCRMQNLIRRLNAGETAKIAVIGGSMTEGHGCTDTTPGVGGGVPCAWPRRFGDWVRSQFPCWDLRVDNLAQASWNLGTWLASGRMQGDVASYDMVIVDLGVNSQGMVPAEQAHLMDQMLWTLLDPAKPRRQAVLVTESYRVCNAATGDCDAHCEKEHQGAVPFFGGATGNYTWCDRWYHIQDNEMAVVRHYGVPVASYRDAVWADHDAPPPELPCYWNGLSHPDANAHVFFATVVAHSFYRTITQWCVANDTTCQTDEAIAPYQVVTSDAGFCAARDGRDRTNLVPDSAAHWPAEQVTGDWRLTEDVRGKPGWLVDIGDVGGDPTRGSAHTVSFSVTLSSSPQLEVTYLRTYEHIGAARLYVGPPNMTHGSVGTAAVAAYELSGLNRQRYSVPHTTILNPHEETQLLLAAAAAGNATTTAAAGGSAAGGAPPPAGAAAGGGHTRGVTVLKAGFEAIAKAPGRYTLLFELVPSPYGKFKLLQIMSC